MDHELAEVIQTIANAITSILLAYLARKEHEKAKRRR